MIEHLLPLLAALALLGYQEWRHQRERAHWQRTFRVLLEQLTGRAMPTDDGAPSTRTWTDTEEAALEAAAAGGGWY